MIASTIFIVRGNPAPKGRARSSLARDSDGIVGIRHRTPDKTRRYEHDVLSAALKAHGNKPMFTGAIQVDTEFRMEIPKSWPAGKKAAAASEIIYHTSKPDKDNLEKAVFDACNGKIWRDDCLIVAGRFRKFYSFEPCAIVTVTALETGDSDML